MTHTALPSTKGQITIPADIRKKYNIDQSTPLLITDNGKGTITMKVMQLVSHDQIKYYEDEKAFGLRFKKGIDPQHLIDAIKEIDG